MTMSSSIVTAGNVDLSNCAREQIQIPGSIQPHGVLIAVSEADRRIMQVSANSMELLGCAPEGLLGKKLDALLGNGLGEAHPRFWEQQVVLKRMEGNPLFLTPMQIGNRWFEGSIHRYGGALLLQLEPHRRAGDEDQTLDVYMSARSVTADLKQARSVGEFSDITARYVREHTGYDRVVIYRFLPDDSGEVVGESKRADLTSWLGLRYPASDIPSQARQLYLQSWVRIIADVNAVPSPMVPALNPETGRPLDMSYCVLRSVSPVHLQYLRNMGSQASMSLSLIDGNRLWGLIACQHEKPRQVSHEARIACEFLAHSVSLQIRSKEDEESLDYSLKLRENVQRMTEFMAGDAEFQDGLLKHRPDVMSLFRAGGAAVVIGSKVIGSKAMAGNLNLRGLTPDANAVNALLEWLKQQPFSQGIFSTQRLSEIHPEAAAYPEKASGLLAIRVEEAELQWLLWFRPELVQMVNWAGDPRKPTDVDEATGLLTLSPRRSFELWQEEKRGVSEPWLAEELRVAGELRQAVVEVALRRARKLKRDNENLTRSNDELESFAYAASHDLKEPLRGIQTYLDMLSQTLNVRLTDRETQAMAMVMRLARRMDELIDSLLDYSRVGRLDLESEEIDGSELVSEALQMLKHQLQSQGVEVRVPRPLPCLTGDRVRLREVLQNLITNAVKYNDKANKWVEIGYREGPPLALYVRDNGIGIEERHHAAVFRIFNRLHGRDAFGGGTGVGLTIVQKVIERHGGRIWLESKPDEGSTFCFTLGDQV